MANAVSVAEALGISLNNTIGACLVATILCGVYVEHLHWFLAYILWLTSQHHTDYTVSLSNNALTTSDTPQTTPNT